MTTHSIDLPVWQINQCKYILNKHYNTDAVQLLFILFSYIIGQTFGWFKSLV